MNGPQRTACLAKGCINNQYQLTIPRQWERPMVTVTWRTRGTPNMELRNTDGQTLSTSYVWPVPLPDNESTAKKTSQRRDATP